MKRAWPWLMTGIAVVAAVGFDVVFPYYSHAESWWHTSPGFDFVYGLIGCTVTVLFSKWLGRFLSRPEDYYERDPE